MERKTRRTDRNRRTKAKLQTRVKWHKLRDRGPEKNLETQPGAPAPLKADEATAGSSDGADDEGRDESLALRVFWDRKFAAVVMTAAILALLLSLLPTANALVNMRDASFSKTWIDLDASKDIPGFIIRRTYDSRSVRNGVFGFGWCGDFEVSLMKTAGGALKLRECGIEGDSIFKPDPFSSPLAPIFRSAGRSDEQITFDGASYRRAKGANVVQRFDTEGRLVENLEPATRLSYRYDTNGQLARIEAINGKSLTFSYSAGRLKKILAPDQASATYTFSGEDLIRVTNAYENTYLFHYDDLHNLTLVKYPDASEESLEYDGERDWIMAYKGRDGCRETYEYRRHHADPDNAQISVAVRKCGDKTTGVAKFEFWHQLRSDAEKALTRMRVERNGTITDTSFHPVTGKPTSQRVVREPVSIQLSKRSQQ